MSDMFTRSIYSMTHPKKLGEGVIKFVKEPNVERYTVITQTKVRITPNVPLAGREDIMYSARLVQTFHSKEAGLAEYNKQQSKLEFHGWERKIPNARRTMQRTGNNNR